MAKKSGEILAYAIASQIPFGAQSISLVGFSLGSQVLYSCLYKLRELSEENEYIKDIIYNVNFMAGCVPITRTPVYESIDDYIEKENQDSDPKRIVNPTVPDTD